MHCANPSIRVREDNYCVLRMQQVRIEWSTGVLQKSQFTNHPEVCRHLELVFKLVMTSHSSNRRFNLAIGIHECVNDLVGHLCSSLKKAISKIVSRAERGCSPPGSQQQRPVVAQYIWLSAPPSATVLLDNPSSMLVSGGNDEEMINTCPILSSSASSSRKKERY